MKSIVLPLVFLGHATAMRQEKVKNLVLADQGAATEHTINFKVSPQTVNILPGVFHLSKGVNKYAGVPAFEGGQSTADVFTFTFDKQIATSGAESYLVPD